MTETEKTLLIRRLKQLPHLSINDIIKKNNRMKPPEGVFYRLESHG